FGLRNSIDPLPTVSCPPDCIFHSVPWVFNDIAGKIARDCSVPEPGFWPEGASCALLKRVKASNTNANTDPTSFRCISASLFVGFSSTNATPTRTPRQGTDVGM